MQLRSTSIGDSWDAAPRLDGAGRGAARLDAPDDLERLDVADLAENDVLAVEPGGHDGGDEELRAITITHTHTRRR